MPRLGDTRATLMLGERFSCSGWLDRLDYFRGSRDGSAFLGVWSKTGTLDYVMKGLVELPPAPIGIHSVEFDQPVRVEQGDFLGIHYASVGVPSGVIAYAIPEDNVIPSDELSQVLVVNVHERDITPYKTLNLGDEELEYEQRAYALQGFLRSDETRGNKTFTDNLHVVHTSAYRYSPLGCTHISRRVLSLRLTCFLQDALLANQTVSNLI